MKESGFLRDHIGDAVNDGVCDAKLLVDQLIGLRLVSQRLLGQRTHQEVQQLGVKRRRHFVLHVRKAPRGHGGSC